MAVDMKLMTVPEAARALRVERQTIYRWIQEGKIPAGIVVRIGGLMRIDHDGFWEWVQSDQPNRS